MTEHDCNDHMIEIDDGYGWDCAICWNRTPPTAIGEDMTPDKEKNQSAPPPSQQSSRLPCSPPPGQPPRLTWSSANTISFQRSTETAAPSTSSATTPDRPTL